MPRIIAAIMALAPGTRLGPYEILPLLGTGGMGEVYRARDTRLERTVAIKILSQLSSDPARRQRFEREAKAISCLNHPNICTLHDVGHQDGIDYLVMECLEGETLAKRLEKRPLPVDQVLKYGAQIADALDKAHRAGIVHRDLKPSNIMLTPTGAKLLDFGLAKPAISLTELATMTATKAEPPVTDQGTIVGTFQYMSPEQVEGRELDGRSDIFSLGAVLYEMVTGQRAFEGKSRLSVASAILEKEPSPITKLKPLAPAALDHAIRGCLAKDPDDRWQTARDLSHELKWIAEGGSQAGVGELARPALRKWQRAGWVVSALLLVLLAGGAAVWRGRMQERKSAFYFNSPVRFVASGVALSPDGKTLAMVGYDEQTNKYIIWIQELGSRKVMSVPGTNGALHPFWSPDGRSIGFFAEGKLKKVDAFSGKPAQTLCEAPNGRGGTWNSDGVILFSLGFGGLYRVPSVGGTPTEVTTVDASHSSHRWPRFLPDGRHFLYLAANFSGQPELNEILVGSLDSTERRPIVNASSNVAYADPGYLIYMRDKALVAQRFDAKTLTLSGEASPISDDVNYSPQDLAVFDVAADKTLVIQTGKGAALSQLTWVDRSGQSRGIVGPSGGISNPSLSPDGRRVAFGERGQDGQLANIWINDLNNGAATRFTFTRTSVQIPTWSPDGKWVAFASEGKVRYVLYKKNSDGSGTEQEIADLGARQQAVWDWSRDGQYLLIMKNTELWYLAASDRVAKPLLQVKGAIRNAQFSPDGKWVAYASNEDGPWQVYVTSFPNATSKFPVSTDGGEEPRWRRDGKELFYLSGARKLMVVPVKTGNAFEAGSPVSLFQTHARQQLSAMDLFSYDVSADGQKFLINTSLEEGRSAPISVILNWTSELER